MKITVSGKEFDVEEGITVSRLMEQLSIETPQYVTVAVNKAFQPMERYDCHALQEGDRVEFLYYMGGGAMALTGEQLERYSRHIILKEVGLRGQKKLLNAKVLIIGAGGLGSPAAMYLAAAGVGTIGIADADEVDLSNLQRQILHSAADVGKPKTDSARETIEALNPDVQVNTHHLFVSAENIMELIEPYDFVIDGTDNFAAKFLINDACVLAEKPFCHAGIIRFFGQLMTYVPGKGPCYRCIFRQPPPPDAVPTCRQAGVIGAMAGVIGCMQALEAVKFIVGAGDLLTGRLLTFEALDMEAHVIQLSDNPDCAVCGAHPTILAPFDEGAVECDLK